MKIYNVPEKDMYSILGACLNSDAIDVLLWKLWEDDGVINITKLTIKYKLMALLNDIIPREAVYFISIEDVAIIDKVLNKLLNSYINSKYQIPINVLIQHLISIYTFEMNKVERYVNTNYLIHFF